MYMMHICSLFATCIFLYEEEKVFLGGKKKEINIFSYSWYAIKYFLTRGMYGPHLGRSKYLGREDKPSCPILQIRIWTWDFFIFFFFK